MLAQKVHSNFLSRLKKTGKKHRRNRLRNFRELNSIGNKIRNFRELNSSGNLMSVKLRCVPMYICT
jgi:hypothetical protein